MKQGIQILVKGICFWMFLSIQTLYGQEDTCYGDLGCFSNRYPWSSPERPIPPPQDPQTVGTKIYCYTRNSVQRFNITLRPQISLNGCQFSASRVTVFITNGYLGDGNATWLDMLKTYYLIQVDANIFLVDWGPGAQTPNYLQAVSNTRVASAEVVRFLNYLARTFGLTADKLHLIGFSLGAHLFSYTSNNFCNITKRITALDPAQPTYERADKRVRLDARDATFVDVIHTSAYPFFPFLGFGYMEPCGHVDIYMNNGTNQPGCPLPSELPSVSSIDDLQNLPTDVIKQTVFCSHARSFMYFVSAVGRNCTFVVHKTNYTTIPRIASAVTRQITTVSYPPCTRYTCTVVGLKTPHYPARGVFVGNTTSSPPYCVSGGDPLPMF